MPRPTPSLACRSERRHLGPGRRHDDRDAARRLAHEPRLDAVDRPTDLALRTRLALEERPQHREVVAHLGERPVHREAEQPLVDVPVAGTDPEREPPSGQLVEGERGGRRRLRRAGVGVGDVRPDLDTLRRRRDRGERHERVAHPLDHVHGVRAGRLGAPGAIDGVGDRAPQGEVQGQLRHRRSPPRAASPDPIGTPAGWHRHIMQRAVWTPDGLVVEDAEPGPLPDGWARLHVEACGICGTDLHLADGQLPAPLGTVPGHEFVGTLLEAPPGTPDIRYAGSPMVVCGTCEHCVAGELNLCRRGGDLIGIGRDGALASWVDVPVANLVPLAAEVEPAVGVLAEPMAVAVRGVGHARLSADDTVLVLGAGTIGLLTAAVARTRTDRVVVSARHAHQRAAAEALGLDVVDEADVTAWGKAEKPRVVLETVGGTASTLDTAISVVRRGGVIVILGTFPRTAVDLLVAALKEITLLPSYAYASSDGEPDFARAADMLAVLRDVLPAVVTHRLPLMDVAAAFEIAADKSTGAIKVTLAP